MIRIISVLVLLAIGLLCVQQTRAQIPNVKFTSQCIGNDANTMLLVHANGTNGSTTIPDSSLSARGNATVNGSAAVATSTSRFGGGSLSLGTSAGNYITFPASSAWQLGTSDFTLDYWAQVNSVGSTVFWSQSASSGWIVGADSTNGMSMSGAYNGSSYAFQRFSSFTTTTSVWHHYAYVRSGVSYFNFKDGVSQTINTSVGAVSLNLGPSTAQLLRIGGQSAISSPLVDELRVSNVARWTANFTPPSQPYCP